MRYVIIGAGPAGVMAAQTLRELAPSAEIVLVGKEKEPPYSRMAIPYLLTDKISESGTYLRKADDFYQTHNIQLLQGQVTRLDPQQKQIHLQHDTNPKQETLSYDKLLIASGATPVSPPIPGIDAPGVSTCWTLEDARQIIAGTQPGSKVVLMGAGFIGCIILESLALRNVDLTVVEMGDRMVPRMMNEKAGNLLKQWCIKKGVNVLTSAQVSTIHSAPAPQQGGILASLKRLFAGASEPAQQSTPLRVELANGQSLPADLVISATGVRSNIEFLTGSGIETDQGIRVNQFLQTSDPNIWAAGDVAQGRDFSTGEFQVQAIQPTSVEHGKLAARNMAGTPTPHRGSINMNVLDTLGLISCSFGLWMGVEDGDNIERYWPEAFRYLNLQFRDDVLVGASCVGMTEHVGVLRGLIQSEVPLGPWKDALKKDPSRLMEAYLASTQGAALRSKH